MAIVYVEARPKGRQAGTPIDDYVVEDHADHVLHTSSTRNRQSVGRSRMGMRLTLLGFAISPTMRYLRAGTRKSSCTVRATSSLPPTWRTGANCPRSKADGA
jgi:hypothetical protein